MLRATHNFALYPHKIAFGTFGVAQTVGTFGAQNSLRSQLEQWKRRLHWYEGHLSGVGETAHYGLLPNVSINFGGDSFLFVHSKGG